jgi:hypothetical protein
MPTLLVLAVYAALLGSPMAAAPAVEDFAVRIDRPYFVGEQYRLRGPYLVADSLSVTRGRDTQRSEHRRLIDLDLAVKVLELGPRGNPRRASVTVHVLTREAGGETTALVAPGTVIDAHIENGKKVFSIQGKTLEGEAEPVLGAISILGLDDRPSEGAMGSRERRRVGESWPLHAEEAARALSAGASAFKIDPQKLKGTVTLAAKKEERQVPCLEYRYELEVKDQRIPREGLPSSAPPGFDHGTFAVTFQGTTILPLDVSLPSPREDQTWDSRLSLTRAVNGSVVTVEMRILAESHVEASLLPQTPEH